MPVTTAGLDAAALRETFDATEPFTVGLEEEVLLGFVAVKSLEGEQHGRTIRYWSYTQGSGKSRTHWIAVGVVPRATEIITPEPATATAAPATATPELLLPGIGMVAITVSRAVSIIDTVAPSRWVT